MFLLTWGKRTLKLVKRLLYTILIPTTLEYRQSSLQYLDSEVSFIVYNIPGTGFFLLLSCVFGWEPFNLMWCSRFVINPSYFSDLLLEHLIILSKMSCPLLIFFNSRLLGIHLRLLTVSDKRFKFFSLPECDFHLMRLYPVSGRRLSMSFKEISGCCCTLCMLGSIYSQHPYITCLPHLNPMIVQSLSFFKKNCIYFSLDIFFIYISNAIPKFPYTLPPPGSPTHPLPLVGPGILLYWGI